MGKHLLLTLVVFISQITFAADKPVLTDRPVFVKPVPEAAINPSKIRKETITLDGAWKFGRGAKSKNLDEIIQVPYAPQSKLSGVNPDDKSLEFLRYERSIIIPNHWEGSLLNFGAVDYHCEVYVNGSLVARHSGGYDPFSVDISAHLEKGVLVSGGRRHTITVRVRDSEADRTKISGKQERRTNEGVIFYKNMSGIWKSVYLERVGSNYISQVKMQGTMDGNLEVDAKLKPNTSGTVRMTLRYENESTPVLQKVIPFENGKLHLEETIANVKTWSTDKPQLYFADFEVFNNQGKAVDHIKSYTGFRTFSMGKGYYLENGKPYQLRGVLNQAVFPDSLYTSSDEKTLNDMMYFKGDPSKGEIGINGERRHQTTPRDRDQWLSDRNGYWMAIEMPSARNLTNKAHLQEALKQAERIIDAYAFRPSVYFVVVGNEDWGLLEDKDHETTADDELREKFQFEVNKMLMRAAPKRMLMALQDGWRVVTTLKDGKPVPGLDPKRVMLNFHDYSTAEELQKNYGSLPLELPAGTALPANQKQALHANGYQYNGDTPIMLSEMGGRAVSTTDAKIFAYGSIFKDTGEWAKAMGQVMETAGSLSSIRGGWVITQARDAGNDPSDPLSGGELNGLLTADGRAKVPRQVFQQYIRRSYEAWRTNYELLQQRQTPMNSPRLRVTPPSEKLMKCIGTFG